MTNDAAGEQRVDAIARSLVDNPPEQDIRVTSTDDIRFLLARLRAVEEELEIGRMGWRHGTPFDPTGVKNATEITSLRKSLEQAETRERALVEALTLVLQTWAETWDCSRDPGHMQMQEACIKAEAALTPPPPRPE